MSQPKSFTAIDGKRVRLSPLVPAADIRWLVARYHVGMSAAEIESDILNRAAAWPADCQRQAVAYALRCHADNGRLYDFVTGR